MVIFCVVGGAGSLGRRLTEELLKPEYEASAIRILDSNENGIARMKWNLKDNRLRWLLGDIRDKERLLRAFDGVDVVINCAALKHIELCEFSPFESVKTNVIGLQNCIEAALDKNVDKFLHISSDKAVQACSTYGRCKALGESLTLDANNYKGDNKRTKLSICRPPNYLDSDGSVTELWDNQISSGKSLTVTDSRMTRYFLTFSEIIAFIMKTVYMMQGGEIFIPNNCRPTSIYELAKTRATQSGSKIEITGLRPGEKLEEVLIDPAELERAEVQDGMWILRE